MFDLGGLLVASFGVTRALPRRQAGDIIDPHLVDESPGDPLLFAASEPASASEIEDRQLFGEQMALSMVCDQVAQVMGDWNASGHVLAGDRKWTVFSTSRTIRPLGATHAWLRRRGWCD